MGSAAQAGRAWRAPSLALVLVVTIVAVHVLTRNVLVAEIVQSVALVISMVCCLRLARAGRTPDGISGRALAAMVATWLVAHVLEVVTLALGADPSPRPSTVAFLAGAIVPVIVAVRLWRRAGLYGHWTVLIRTALDMALAAVGVQVVVWHAIVALGLDVPPGQLMIVCCFALLGGAISGALVVRFVQRRDTGSLLLAISAVLGTAGLYLKALEPFGIDLQWQSVMLMTVTLVFLVWAVGHPSNSRAIVLEMVERDVMGALVFNLICWMGSFLVLLGKSIGWPTAGLGIASIVLVYLRVALVRSSEARLVRKLRVLAFTDALTGFGNRRSLTVELESREGWLITIDLDGFKEINDRYGHDAGDDVLREFANRIGGLGPPETHVARIGGDEFAVLFAGSAEQARSLANLILAEARDPRYARLTASVGLSWHARGADPKKSLRDSDIAMQEAKRFGKDRLAILTGGMVEDRLRDLDLAGRLAETLTSVDVVYQPIVAMASGRPVIAVEALARWSHPQLGPVSPAEFIPIAEQQGLVAQLGAVVLKRVIDQLQVWLAAGAPRQVSVNVSWLQLRDRETVEYLAEQVRAHPEVARWLVLEVTESVFSEDDSAVAAVVGLRDLGLCIALDDFGTGASNFRRLRSMPADILKIDRSMLDGLAEDPEAIAMMSAVVGLGEALGMAVIAEGIEDAEADDLVAGLGVTAAQGYHFARPAAADKIAGPLPLADPWLGRREFDAAGGGAAGAGSDGAGSDGARSDGAEPAGMVSPGRRPSVAGAAGRADVGGAALPRPPLERVFPR